MRLVLGAVVLGAALTLGACARQNDEIVEVEYGRNGMAVEVYENGEGTEVYLRSDSGCEEGDLLRDCAQPEDYLVEVDGQRSRDRTDDNEDDGDG